MPVATSVDTFAPPYRLVVEVAVSEPILAVYRVAVCAVSVVKKELSDDKNEANRPLVVDVPVTVVEANIPEPPVKIFAAATFVVRLAIVVEPSVDEPATVRLVMLAEARVVEPLP